MGTWAHQGHQPLDFLTWDLASGDGALPLAQAHAGRFAPPEMASSTKRSFVGVRVKPHEYRSSLENRWPW